MKIVIIPGFWLDGDSWNDVAKPLEAAGHSVAALTLPGKRPGDTDLAGIGLRDQVDAVVAVIDSLSADFPHDPIVLVGHSGGAAIGWAAVDARAAAISRLVLVDSLPFAAGSVINDELPIVGDAIPLPDWSFFEEADLTDLTDDLRERFRQMALVEPAAVATDSQQLHDEARFSVPVTVIACEFPEAVVRQAMSSEVPWASELSRIDDLHFIELPTGHWPQFTKPTELAASILTAVAG